MESSQRAPLVVDGNTRNLPSSATTVSPFVFGFSEQVGMPPTSDSSPNRTSWPPKLNAVDQIDSTHPAPLALHPTKAPATLSLNLVDSLETTAAFSYLSLTPTEAYLNLHSTPNTTKDFQTTAFTSLPPISGKAKPDKLVEDSFDTPIGKPISEEKLEELPAQHFNLTKIEETNDILAPDKPVCDNLSSNPFEDPLLDLTEEPT
jgi:hypothetical protein